MSQNYLETYKKRISHLGSSPQERAFNSGILEFRRYLKYNQHVVSNLNTHRNNDTKFRGAILTDREDENRVSQILLVELDVDIEPGDLVQWGEGAPWLVYRSTTSSYQPYQKFHMVRCNYEMRWVDEEGRVQESWIYLLGHKDSKVKDNFRTWNNLITPQPNKYIEIILPHTKIKQGTEIMIIDEVWYLVDYDQNSVPGIIYMSFTETNLNAQRDSLEEKLANVDTVAVWELDVAETRSVMAGELFEINYSVSKNGLIQDDIKPIITWESEYLTWEGDKIRAGKTYDVFVDVKVSYNGVEKIQTISITHGTQEEELIIVGDNKIRVGGRKQVVYSVGVDAVFSLYQQDEEGNLIETDLAAITKADTNTCAIETNKENKLGTIILVANADTQTATKAIDIVPLWQVI